MTNLLYVSKSKAPINTGTKKIINKYFMGDRWILDYRVMPNVAYLCLRYEILTWNIVWHLPVLVWNMFLINILKSVCFELIQILLKVNNKI